MGRAFAAYSPLRTSIAPEGISVMTKPIVSRMPSLRIVRAVPWSAVYVNCKPRGTFLCLIVVGLSVAMHLFVTLSAYGNPQDDKDFFELEETLRHRGESLVNSGEFRFTVSREVPKRSEESVLGTVDFGKRLIAEEIARTTDEARREELEETLRTLEAEVRRQIQAKSRVASDCFFAFDGPALGGDRVVEVTFSSDGLEAEGFDAVYRAVGNLSHTELRVDRLNSLATIDNNRFYYGIQEPHTLGRIVGALESSALLLRDNPKAFRLGIRGLAAKEIEKFQGRRALELVVETGELGGNDVPSRTVLTTVPEMGYITPRVRDIGPDGEVIAEWRSTNYVEIRMPNQESLWFPLAVTYRQTSPDGKDPTTETSQFDAFATYLNRAVPHDRFAVKITPSAYLTDNREGSSATYRPLESIVLSLDDVDSLDKNPRLKRVDLVARDAPAAPSGTRWPVGVLVNVALLMAVLTALWLRRRGATAGLLLLVLVPGCGFVPNRIGKGLPDQDRGALIIIPESIDFGTVSSSCDVRYQSFRIENPAGHLRRVAIKASCGCLAVSPKSLELRAGGSGVVTASLSPDGRAGRRQSQISIIWNDGKDVDVPSLTGERGMKVLDATAMISNEWHATPSRMIVAMAQGEGEGAVTITAPCSEWSRAAIGVIGRDVTWQQVSQPESRKKGFESRTYRVGVVGQGGGDRGLSVTFVGQENPILVVPIIATR